MDKFRTLLWLLVVSGAISVLLIWLTFRLLISVLQEVF